MRATLILAGLAFAMTLTAAGGAGARDMLSISEHGDWRAAIFMNHGGEESWKECVASTGGDGLPVLSVFAHEFDAAPPYSFPTVSLTERAMRGVRTVMTEGDEASFSVDKGEVFSGIAMTWLEGDAYMVAEAPVDPGHALPLLQAMKRGYTMSVSFGGNKMLEASMNGFSAAYQAIADGCSFSTMGVLTPMEESLEPVLEGASPEGNVRANERVGSWNYLFEMIDTSDSFVTQCSASLDTAEGMSIGFSVNSLEVVPPQAYPSLIISQSIEESLPPMVQPGGLVQVLFNTGLVVPGEVLDEWSDEGVRYVVTAVKPRYAAMGLREMTVATEIAVYMSGQLVHDFRNRAFVVKRKFQNEANGQPFDWPARFASLMSF